ncbi:restriction endonuclease subunit S [Zafaria sp. J156]|uniref:restriction endonuclease subunit S n=1 Tax=Zafaria sp. J156 TaxID=3116490 RepID=UPI002E784D1B|nr:restriction endonuclease subunit S [Zafaria sp. J156]MEE1621643.1 restriction endonuclease subunit S [Zafaria sp. J156]
MRVFELGDFAVRTQNLNPAQYPNEEFDLLSIPAYDRGFPEVTHGREIGSTKQLVMPGDVMISKIVPHIRRVWVVPEDEGRRQVASGEWMVFRGGDFLASWMRQALLSEGFHQQFLRTVAGVGGSLLRARPAHVHKIRIHLPILDEQRRIADILDKADALRAKRREAIAHLDALGQAIFHEMFGDPVDNEHGWTQLALGQLGVWQSGGTPLRSNGANFGPGYSWFTSGELGQKWLLGSRECITRDGLLTSSAKVVPTGALLLGMYDTAALKAGITTDEATCNQAIAFGLLDEEQVLVEFAYEAIRLGRTRHLARRRGVRQKNFNLSMVRDLRIPVPPMPLQVSFVERLQAIERQRRDFLTQLMSLDSLFHSLQDRAFKGEL